MLRAQTDKLRLDALEAAHRQQMAYGLQTHAERVEKEMLDRLKDVHREADRRQDLLEFLTDTQPREENKMNYGSLTEEQKRNAWGNEEFFDDDYYCEAHSERKCVTCTKKAANMAEEEQQNELALIVSRPDEYGENQKVDAKQRFEQQIDYVQTALKMSNKQVEDVKVKDLGAKMKEANEKITVGQMKKLMGKNIREKGIIETFWYGFIKFLGL